MILVNLDVSAEAFISLCISLPAEQPSLLQLTFRQVCVLRQQIDLCCISGHLQYSIKSKRVHDALDIIHPLVYGISAKPKRAENYTVLSSVAVYSVIIDLRERFVNSYTLNLTIRTFYSLR